MDWLTGMLTGYANRSRKIEDDKFLAAREAAQRENQVFRDLLNSTDKRIASMAATGLILGSQPQKRSKGIAGWMGEMEANPIYGKLLEYLQTPQLKTVEEKPFGGLPSTQSQGISPIGIVPGQTSSMHPATEAPPAPPPPPNAASLPATSPTQVGSAPVTAPPPAPPPAPPGADANQRLLEAQTAQNEPQPSAPPPPPGAAPGVLPATPIAPTPSALGTAPPPPPPPPAATPAHIGAPPGYSSDLMTTTRVPGMPVAGITRTEEYQLPRAYPTQSEMLIAARRAQIQGDFQALRDMYMETGLDQMTASQQAAEDVVRMSQRGGTAVAGRSIEIEWKGADGIIHKELGSYDGRLQRYVNAQGQPFPPDATITRALPASATSGGTFYNRAMNILRVSALDVRNDEVLARQVADLATELQGDVAGQTTEERMEAAARGPTSNAQRNSLTATYQARWNQLDAPVRNMDFYLRAMTANYNRYMAGDAAAWEPLRTAFVRMSEPNSVVMPSEFARAGNIGSLLDRIYGQVGRLLQGGAPLTDPQIDEMMRSAVSVYQEMQTYASGNRSAIESVLTRNGIPLEDVFGQRSSIQDIMGNDLLNSIGMGTTPGPPPARVTPGGPAAAAPPPSTGRATVGKDAQGRTTIIIPDR